MSQKYAVATYWTPNFQEMADLTVPTMGHYCERHGYELHTVIEETHSGWHKMRIVLDLLQTGDYAGVLWLDSDALVTNPSSTRLEDLALFGDFVCTSDCFGISTGTFLARATDNAAKLLWACLCVGDALIRGHQWAEQEAIMRFARFEPYASIVKIVPQRLMNSYYSSAYSRPLWPDATWEPGDFILHLPGMGWEDRVRIARDVLTLMEERANVNV